MKPVNFKQAQRWLKPPKKKDYSENVGSIEPLAIWSDGEQCVSCWKMSLKERFSALFFGKVWLAILSGETQPPTHLAASKEYLMEKDD